MRSKLTVLLLLFTLCMYGQTTVRFAEPNQFFNDSEPFLKLKILVDSIGKYTAEEPIIIQLFSDLKDSRILGITATQAMDKVIFPENYIDGVELQIPVNIKALKNSKSFSLYLRKKGANESFKIYQGVHTVIINKTVVDKSYVGISTGTPESTLGLDMMSDEKIEIPFRLETKGYLPVTEDRAVATVMFKGIEKSNGLYTFILEGAGSEAKIVVEESMDPEIYEKIMEILENNRQLELEISGITHGSPHRIETDLSKQSAVIPVEKVSRVDARYSFHLGTNFEFSTNFEAKDIYYELDISLFGLFKSRWGLRAGMYKNTNSRYLEDFTLRPTHYELVDETEGGQVYNLVQTGMAPGIATESLGFYFEIPYKVIESERFKVFVSPHLELIERRETYTYEIIYESVLATEITSFPLDFSVPRPLPKQVRSKYWEGYLGFSVPMLYRNLREDFEVSINPIFGFGYPGPYAVFTPFYTGIPDDDYIEIVEGDSGTRMFSAFQFNIIINPKKSLGIKLGSDVRKYFGSERKPIISISLSTKIEFSEIFDLAGGK